MRHVQIRVENAEYDRIEARAAERGMHGKGWVQAAGREALLAWADGGAGPLGALTSREERILLGILDFLRSDSLDPVRAANRKMIETIAQADAAKTPGKPTK